MRGVCPWGGPDRDCVSPTCPGISQELLAGQGAGWCWRQDDQPGFQAGFSSTTIAALSKALSISWALREALGQYLSPSLSSRGGQFHIRGKAMKPGR